MLSAEILELKLGGDQCVRNHGPVFGAALPQWRTK